MEDKTLLKKKLYEACESGINKSLEMLEQNLRSIEESRNNETKSSVGDKYETGRAMMQMEEEKSRAQLMQTNLLRNELMKIDLNKVSTQVELGSLVVTDKGTYFIAIGMGKVKLEDGLYYCISTDSPIGLKMKHKTTGELIEFNGNKLNILAIF